MIAELILAVAAITGGEVALTASPPSDERWRQGSSGVVVMVDSPLMPSTPPKTIALRSAITSGPIADSLAWVIPCGDPVPLFTTSHIRSDDGGILQVGEAEGHLLRVAAPGYELVHLARPYPESVVLWPADPATIQFTQSGEPVSGVRVTYALDESIPRIGASAGEDGRITLPFVPREGVRVEVVDDRYEFTSLIARGETSVELERSHPIHSTVVDEQGRPVANARATAWVRYGDAPREVRELWWNADEEGAIAIRGLPASPEMIEFQAEGHLARKVASDDPGIAVVTLRKGRPPVLLVIGPAGPLRDAVVFDNVTQEAWGTGDDGIATLSGVDADRRLKLRVSASNHLSEEIILTPEDPSPREVMLRKGASLRLRVLDASHGVPVRSMRARLSRGGGFFNRELASDDGEYEIAGFAPGPGELTIRVPNLLPITISFDAPLSGLDLGTIFVPRGAAVEGSLLFAESGKPLAGARISIPRRGALGTLASQAFGDVIDAETDADGRFAISGLEGGSVCGTIHHPLIGQSLLQASVEPHASAHLGALALGRGGRLTGRVLDGEGRPLAEVATELRAGPLHSPCSTLRSTVDAEGRFEFSGVAAGQWHLVAKDGPEVLASRAIEIAEGETRKRDLEIMFVEIAGNVFIGGEPARGGSVKLARAGLDAFVPPTVFISYHGRSQTGRQQAVSDIVSIAFIEVAPGGDFHDRARLQSGRYEITFTQDEVSYYADTEVAAEQRHLDLPLRFDGHRLGGWLLDASGAPVANAIVHLEDRAGRRLRSVRTGLDGAFVFPHAPTGPLVTRARRGDLEAVVTVEIDGAREDLALTLRPTTSPSITVAFDEAEGVRIESVHVIDGRETWRSASRGGAETVHVPFLKPGRFRVLGTDAAGGIHLGPEVVLGEGGAAVTLETEGAFRSTVAADVARAGSPVGIFTVEGIPLAPIVGMGGAHLTVDFRGEVVLPPLSEGEWQIAVGEDTPSRIEVSSKKRRISIE